MFALVKEMAANKQPKARGKAPGASERAFGAGLWRNGLAPLASRRPGSGFYGLWIERPV